MVTSVEPEVEVLFISEIVLFYGIYKFFFDYNLNLRNSFDLCIELSKIFRV